MKLSLRAVLPVAARGKMPLGSYVESFTFLQDPLIAFSLAKLWLCLTFAGLVWYHFWRARKKPLPLYGTFWRRFFALLVDAAVLCPVKIVSDHLEVLPWADNRAFGIGSLVLQSAIVLVYRVAMHARYGQTLGKMACRVKVVDAASGGAITFRQALMREASRWVFTLPLLGCYVYEVASGLDWQDPITDPHYADFLAPWLWAAFGVRAAWNLTDSIVCLESKKYRALHDHIAGTVPLNVDAEVGH